MIHPPGDIGFARNADGIALILIAESAKQVIKLVIHLGNPGYISEVQHEELEVANRSSIWHKTPSGWKLENGGAIIPQ